MPRTRQRITLPFGGGMNQKADARALPASMWASLTNVQFTKTGRLTQRNGYNALAKTVSTGGNMTAPVLKLPSFRNELLAIDSTATLYTYQQSNAIWTPIGGVPEATCTRSTVFDASYTQYSPDMCISGDYIIRTWLGNLTSVGFGFTGDLFVAVWDAQSGSLISGPTKLFSSYALSPRVASVGTNVKICFWDNNAAELKTYTTTISSNPTWAANTLAVVPTTYAFDFIALSDRYAVGCFPSGGHVEVFTVDTSSATIATTTISDARVTTQGTLIGLQAGPSNSIFAAYWGTNVSTIGSASLRLTTALATVWGPTALPSGMNAVLPGVCSLSYDASADVFGVAVSGTNGILACVIQDSGSPGSAVGSVVTTPGLLILSRALCLSGRHYLFATNQTLPGTSTQTIQPTTWMLEVSTSAAGAAQALPVCTVAPRLSQGGIRDYGSVANIIQYPDGTYATALSISASAFAGIQSILEAKVTFYDKNGYAPSSAMENLVLGCGVPSCYDSVQAFEAGFELYPEGVTATPGTSGGSMADGTYSYQVTYEYVDASGQIHQSAPSPAVSATVSGGAGSGKITLVVPNLWITRRNNASGSVVGIVVYRTQAGGTTYTRVTAAQVPAGNVSAPNSVSTTIVDTALDANIAANALLYTTGGELPNFCPPAASFTCLHKGRVWLAGTDEGRSIWYSKPLVSGYAAAFNDAFTLTFPEGGRVVALASMDDKLVVFKSDRIYIVYGDGPNVTGAGVDYVTQPIVSDVGCISPASVVICPLGVVFQSVRGIMLLSRSLEVSYIGSAVEDLVGSSTVLAAVLVPAQNQVRFTLSGTTHVPVYDYFVNAWTSFVIADPDGSGSGSTAGTWQGLYVWAGAAGMVYQENLNGLADVTTLQSAILQSAWIKTGDIAGFQRVRRVQVVADQMVDHQVDLTIFSDYYGVTSQDVTWASGTTQMEAHVVNQKCEGMQLELIIQNQNTHVGALFEMLGMAMDIVVDSRLYKGLPQGAKG